MSSVTGAPAVSVECYLREYSRLRASAVVQPDGSCGKLAGAVFDPDDWRIGMLLVDDGDRWRVGTGAIDHVGDDPPEIVLRPEWELRVASARPAHRVETDRLLAYALITRDGAVGRIADLLINIDNWRIKFFVVDNGRRPVLLHVEWTRRVDTQSRKVFVDVPARAFESAPRYAGIAVMTPGYEDVVNRHYTRRDFV
jgi:sporulation protein YlmC with PRC-barrel domain